MPMNRPLGATLHLLRSTNGSECDGGWSEEGMSLLMVHEMKIMLMW